MNRYHKLMHDLVECLQGDIPSESMPMAKEKIFQWLQDNLEIFCVQATYPEDGRLCNVRYLEYLRTKMAAQLSNEVFKKCGTEEITEPSNRLFKIIRCEVVALKSSSGKDPK